MKLHRSSMLTGIAIGLAVIGTGLLAWKLMGSPSARSKGASKPDPPAVVSRTVQEDQFNTIKLTPKAEERLGIRTAVVERRAMPRTRLLGGEVMVPAGHTVLVSAPLCGLLKGPAGGVPTPGRIVKKGQPILLLLPLLTPEAKTTLASTRVEAEAQVENARTQLEAAVIALERARKLFQQEAGSKRMLDEAQAAFDLATKVLDGARARRDLLARAVSDFEKGTAAPITIDSPEDGLLRSVSVLPEQVVPSGAVLFEVVERDKVWVRVPVFVGDRDDIADRDEAQVGILTGRPGASTRSARPVTAPPSANALAATVDLFYELDNLDGGLSPGQRVGVQLPLRGEQESLTAPWAAVIHDINGGTWIYENTAPQTFVRRRVQVRHVAGGVAVLASGPPPGALVVTDGAAELFGTEVGFAK